jgi:predicted Fe-Mo cluster-binding NifX family protein
MKIAAPVVFANIKGEKKLLVSPHFGKAQNFAIYDKEKGEIVLLDTQLPERGKGKFFVALANRLGIDVLLVKSMGMGAYQSLKSIGVKIYKVPSNIKYFEEALSAFLENKLKPFTSEDVHHEEHHHGPDEECKCR